MSTSPWVVRHISECFIKPKQESEEQKKPIYLSPWDYIYLSFRYMQQGLLYPIINDQHAESTSTQAANDVVVDALLNQLKEALSITLVHFHPLAGRFETGHDDEEAISDEEGGRRSSCWVFIDPSKGPGVRFIHAAVDLTIADLLSPTYVPDVVSSFFDHQKTVNHDGHTSPLLSVQVTQLVDGIFIGCSMNHVCGDGNSFWHFFNSWSEIFMKKFNTTSTTYKDDDDKLIPKISRPPIHTRWFIDGSGGSIIKLPYGYPDEFIHRIDDDDDQDHQSVTVLRNRIFHFSSESILRIKSIANSECTTTTTTGRGISSFQALTALIWRCITRARRMQPDEETICSVPTDDRGRIQPPLSNNYFGNCVQLVHAKTTSGELIGQSLGCAAKRVNQALNAHTEKIVRDTMASLTKTPVIAKPGGALKVDPAAATKLSRPRGILMTNSPKFDMYGNQFGIGTPAAVLSGHCTKFDGKLTSYPGREGGGSIDLDICLSSDHMTGLETDQELMAALS